MYLPSSLSCKQVAAKILYTPLSIFWVTCLLFVSSFFCVWDLKYILKELDECCLTLVVYGDSLSFISGLMAMITGDNGLVSLPQDRDLGSITKQLLKLILFQGGSLSPPARQGPPIFTFCWWKRKYVSVHLSCWALGPWVLSLLCPIWSASSFAGNTSAFLLLLFVIMLC